MADKRFCGICATKGHTWIDCPRAKALADALEPLILNGTGTTHPVGLLNSAAVTKPRGGRPKRYETPAAKQKAYRERNK